MVKMIERTAKLLNDTDDFERKLNEMLEENTLRTSWLSFKTEQDERLWEDRPGWKPGDFLYKRPIFGFGGQYIRPIIEMMEDLEFHNHEEVKFTARCKDCDVSWVGPESCWSCGVECAPVVAKCGCGCGLPMSMIEHGNNPRCALTGEDFNGTIESIDYGDEFEVIGARDMSATLSFSFSQTAEQMQNVYSQIFTANEMRMLLGMPPRTEVEVVETPSYNWRVYQSPRNSGYTIWLDEAFGLPDPRPETVVVEGIEIPNVDPMTIEEPRTEMRIRFPGVSPYVDYSPGWSAPLATESRRPRRV